ncbi:hypothetical protein QF044_000187 [Chryseobacterium sp. W4I1]|nr:hypothetical protein [Chryseobacterium sp. W4I1]
MIKKNSVKNIHGILLFKLKDKCKLTINLLRLLVLLI